MMKWTKKSEGEWRAAHKEADLAFRIVGGPDTFMVLIFDYDGPDGIPFAASPEVTSLAEAKKMAKGAVEAVEAEGAPKKKAKKKKAKKKKNPPSGGAMRRALRGT